MGPKKSFALTREENPMKTPKNFFVLTRDDVTGDHHEQVQTLRAANPNPSARRVARELVRGRPGASHFVVAYTAQVLVAHLLVRKRGVSRGVPRGVSRNTSKTSEVRRRDSVGFLARHRDSVA